MKAHSMLTVGDYCPASGRNTFRRSAPKYDEVEPGDQVIMSYADSLEAEPYATERLTVASVVHTQLHRALAFHAPANHLFAIRETRQHSDELKAQLEKVYDDVQPDENFTVIYFA